MDINITVICSIHTNIELLPHFITHYKSMGVENFIFGVWSGKNNPIWENIKQFETDSIKFIKSYDEPLSEPPETAFANRIRTEFLKENDWYIPTDLDEFHVFDKNVNVFDVIDDLNRNGEDCVLGQMVDRTTLDGSIPLHITETPSIWEQFPKNCYLTRELLGAYDKKISLSKQPLYIIEGHHGTYNGIGVISKKESKCYHFKWFGDLLKKEETKLQRYREMGFTYYTENEKLVNILKFNDGKLF